MDEWQPRHNKGSTALRKTLFILALPKRGWGGRKPCSNGLWQLFSEYKPLLRHLIFIIFHQYLPWFPSEYYEDIQFSLSPNPKSEIKWRWIQRKGRLQSPDRIWELELLFLGPILNHAVVFGEPITDNRQWRLKKREWCYCGEGGVSCIFWVSSNTIITVEGNWAVFFLCWVISACIIGAIEATTEVFTRIVSQTFCHWHYIQVDDTVRDMGILPTCEASVIEC